METQQVASEPAAYRGKTFRFAQSKLLRLTLLAALLLPALSVAKGLASHSASGSARAQREVLVAAAQNPDSTVAVIVQKQMPDSNLEQAVGRLGGTITKDLSLINSFVAEMPARSAAQLSTDSRVRWVSLDSPMVKTVLGVGDSSNLQSTYVRAVGADRIWNESQHYQGQGIGVAVVDSGVDPNADLCYPECRLVASVRFNSTGNQTTNDVYGHGTHIAGIIAGNSTQSYGGRYMGVAPGANIISVKVSDDTGVSTASDVVQGLQWINEHKDEYNIRVVNISLNGSLPSLYHTDPIDAAVEILWFSGVVVVASAGNGGFGSLNAPANDPFVITVGAVDDRGTAGTIDDAMTSFSAYGVVASLVSKPDLVAPGVNIVSRQSTVSSLAADHPGNTIGDYYFRMTGTSMAAPVVAGAAALLLQSNPDLTPDQVKYRLKSTARPFDLPLRTGAGYLDTHAALHGTSTASANTGIPASLLLWTGEDTPSWNGVNWNSANWGTVNWSSVNWTSVNWTSIGGGPLVNWTSDYWGQ